MNGDSKRFYKLHFLKFTIFKIGTHFAYVSMYASLINEFSVS